MAVFASALLDGGASHNFIAAPQVIKFSKSIHKSFLFPAEDMKVQLTYNSLVIFHQIMHLKPIFADSAVHAVELWVVLALNHAIILGMPFLHTLSPCID